MRLLMASWVCWACRWQVYPSVSSASLLNRSPPPNMDVNPRMRRSFVKARVTLRCRLERHRLPVSSSGGHNAASRGRQSSVCSSAVAQRTTTYRLMDNWLACMFKQAATAPWRRWGRWSRTLRIWRKKRWTSSSSTLNAWPLCTAWRKRTACEFCPPGPCLLSFLHFFCCRFIYLDLTAVFCWIPVLPRPS